MFKPTVKQTTRPGPAVAAIPSISDNFNLLTFRDLFIINSIYDTMSQIDFKLPIAYLESKYNTDPNIIKDLELGMPR